MAHSDEAPALGMLLVIAPTGAYTGRVRTGINLVLGSEAALEQTKVRVILIAGKEWLEDSTYRQKFVDPLQAHVLDTWKTKGKMDVECQVKDLPMQSEEHLTAWLLTELSTFFSGTKAEAEAYIDLTAGPKEWQFAAMNVSNFFENLELYYVGPETARKPTEYDSHEVDDPGFPKLESVRTGEPRRPLLQWRLSKDEKGKPNPHYILFKTIYELAKKQAETKGVALDKVWVPILERQGLDAYRERLPREHKTKLTNDAGLMRHIGKLLNGVEAFRLFERTPKSTRMTLRGTALAQSIFEKK
jgi:hypothetical protein